VVAAVFTVDAAVCLDALLFISISIHLLFNHRASRRDGSFDSP
jgi:hypothetical protein